MSFLSPLYEEIGITTGDAEFDKCVLAVMVLECLTTNVNLTLEQYEEIVQILVGKEEHFSGFMFSTLTLAASTCYNGFQYKLEEKYNIKMGTLTKDYIWVFLSKNEILPGVKMIL